MKNVDEKLNAAIESLNYIPKTGLVGIGTGSTVAKLIGKMSERNEEYVNNLFIPTSEITKKLLLECGFNVTEEISEKIIVDIDGADEIDREGNLVKGGGGALTREKIVAKNSKKVVIIADSSKFVENLGKFKIPIEVLPFLYKRTMSLIKDLGANVNIRYNGNFKSDNGNLIFDADFGLISNPRSLEMQIKEIPGVVEVGIFSNMTDLAIIGTKNETKKILFSRKR